MGVDPHKESVTIEAIDGQGKKEATGSFGTTTRDNKAILGCVPSASSDHTTGGPSRVPSGWADHWHNGRSPMASRWSTSP